MVVYELTSENLTGLGGPMGSERTWANWRRLFVSPEAAMRVAESDYGKRIHWERSRGPTCNGVPLDVVCSGDLGSVMYHVRVVEVEG